MDTTYVMEYVMDCGEVSCEYCSKDRCIYMTNNEIESEISNEASD